MCPGSTNNNQYIAAPKDQYEYIIEVPATRSLPIVVALNSPAKTTTAPDDSGGGTITTTYTMRSPDNTPFDDTDNPVTTCSGTGQSNPRSYATGVVDNDYTYFGMSAGRASARSPLPLPAGSTC